MCIRDRDKAHRYLNEIDLSELCCARHVDLLRAEKSIGTLGGGNHFIEVDKDDEGNLYIVVHSGSRHSVSYTHLGLIPDGEAGGDFLIDQLVQLLKLQPSPRMRVVSMPQPISTPTRLGTTLSVMVIVVPMVQPAPAWMSGMSRMRLRCV